MVFDGRVTGVGENLGVGQPLQIRYPPWRMVFALACSVGLMLSPSMAWRTTRGAGDFTLQRDSGLMSTYGRDVLIDGVMAIIVCVLLCLPSLRDAHVVRTYLGYVLSAVGIVGFWALLRYTAQTTHLDSLAVQNSLDSGFYERVAANWGVLLALLVDIVLVGLGVVESLRETRLRRVPDLMLPTAVGGAESD